MIFPPNLGPVFGGKITNIKTRSVFGGKSILLYEIVKNKEILEIFGLRVQKYKKQKGICQEKLAELADLHRTYIEMIERVERKKSITILELYGLMNSFSFEN